jgi:choline monooxygenase
MKAPIFDSEDLEQKPLERAETIPSHWYFAEDVYTFEQEALFSRTWQYVGSADQCASIGSFITAEVAGNPIIIIRGKDSVLRAFYNVCRHRGGPLCTEISGTTDMLQCQYHGWTYTLEGMLRGVPHFKYVELFDKKDFGLHEVALQEWQGLLFVNCANSCVTNSIESESPQSVSSQPNTLFQLDDLLAGISERISPLRLDSLRFAERVIYHEECNWKVYIDNYLEGYHIPIVHPELNKILDYRNYTTELSKLSSLQTSTLTGENIYGSSPDDRAWYYWLFPNMMLNILPDRLQVNLVIPTSPITCDVMFDYYYSDTDSIKIQQLKESDKEYSDMIQMEDSSICRHVQKGLQSKAYHKGRFSVRFESGVHHFQSLLRSVFAGRDLS